MKPIDLRNATWSEIRGRLHDLRLSAYEAYLNHGPGTTREVARASGMDLLTLRPRTTELLQLGFLVLVNPTGDHRPKEGTYRALTEAEAMDAWLARKADAARLTQLDLALA